MSNHPHDPPDERQDPLDAALSRVPREVPPTRDLWPGILAQIEASSTTSGGPDVRRRQTWMPWAAAVLMAVGASFSTYLVMQSTQDDQTIAALPASKQMQSADPMSVRAVLETEYVNARANLDETFAKRLASLPPEARAKVERNLEDLRRAAREISRTLEQHPSDPLLQELLMSTYQRELRLLADVTQMTSVPNTSVDL